MKNKLFIKLDTLCTQITEHPELSAHLTTKGGRPLLPLDQIVNGFTDATDEFRALLSDLEGELGDLFIGEDGDPTRAFYSVRDYGYHTEIPKSSINQMSAGMFGDKSGKWFVYYG